MTASVTIDAVEGVLAPHGLFYRGGFKPAPGTLDIALGTVVLIGNAGLVPGRSHRPRWSTKSFEPMD